jgi:hypothetical protein
MAMGSRDDGERPYNVTEDAIYASMALVGPLFTDGYAKGSRDDGERPYNVTFKRNQRVEQKKENCTY